MVWILCDSKRSRKESRKGTVNGVFAQGQIEIISVELLLYFEGNTEKKVSMIVVFTFVKAVNVVIPGKSRWMRCGGNDITDCSEEQGRSYEPMGNTRDVGTVWSQGKRRSGTVTKRYSGRFLIGSGGKKFLCGSSAVCKGWATSGQSLMRSFRWSYSTMPRMIFAIHSKLERSDS